MHELIVESMSLRQPGVEIPAMSRSPCWNSCAEDEMIAAFLKYITFFHSVDGVPFLMRDRTLRRTTDVSKVFPARQFDDASLFNWTEIRSLNAGQWFLEVLKCTLPNLTHILSTHHSFKMDFSLKYTTYAPLLPYILW